MCDTVLRESDTSGGHDNSIQHDNDQGAQDGQGDLGGGLDDELIPNNSLQVGDLIPGLGLVHSHGFQDTEGERYNNVLVSEFALPNIVLDCTFRKMSLYCSGQQSAVLHVEGRVLDVVPGSVGQTHPGLLCQPGLG